MKRPGQAAMLYYDGGAECREGDYIRTPTGRTYLITHVRVQEKGRHIGRQHLTTVVMAPDHQTEPDATVWPLHWYRRN